MFTECFFYGEYGKRQHNNGLGVFGAENRRIIMYKVKINDCEYTIIETDNEYDISLEINGNYHLGTCDKYKQEIVLLNTIPNEMMKKTLIHELVHAFIDAHGFHGYSFKEESMCNFIEAYSENIVKIANEYMKKRNKNKLGFSYE